MKYEKHHLNDDGKSPVYCPLSSEAIQCDSFCAWFDHEVQDCRMIGGFMKVREGLTDITYLLTDIRTVLKK